MKLRTVASSLCLSACLLSSLSARAETWTEVSTSAESCFQMQFLSESMGFINGGTIKKTVDGGVTWTEIKLGNFESPRAFHFFDEQNGVVIMGNPVASQTTQTVLHTTNGGSSWTPGQSLPFGASLATTMRFYSPTNGYLMGRDTSTKDYVYKTTDAGKTWVEANTGSYKSVFFVDDNLGFSNGSAGIHRTDNGGTSWTFQYKPNVGIANTVEFFDKNFGLAQNTQLYQILYTANGGTQWNTTQIGGANKQSRGWAFHSGTEAIALVKTNTQKNEIWRTADGGANWSQDTLPAGYEDNSALACVGWVSATVQYAGFLASKKILRVGTPGTGPADAGVDSGTGGSAGSAGAAGATGGSAGSSATGGSAGSGASSSGGQGGSTATGGATSSGGSSGGGGSSGDDEGCGCSTPGGRGGSPGLLLMGLGAVALRRRNRRVRVMPG